VNARTWLRSSDGRYTALAAVLAALLLAPALAQPTRLVYPSWSDFCDLTLIHWPKVALIRESLAQGQGWPLWSPYALSGQPLAANQLAMLFYPPALLLLVGPLAWSFSLFYALHLAWAGIGTYWLARGLGCRPGSSLLAATIFALSGKLVAHTAAGHASLIAAISWTPWAFAFLQRALARRSAPFAVLTGVALAAQVTTHSYALVYTAYGLILFAVLYVLLVPGNVGAKLRAALPLARHLAFVPTVAILLGAAQLLPLLEMARYSNRALSFTQATLFSTSPLQTLTGLLLPTPNVGHEWILYPGLVTVGLVAASWRARRERYVLIFAVLTSGGIFLAMGHYTPLYRLAYGLLPGLHWLRTPGRLWFFVTLGLAILAAYGFEQWQSLWRHASRRTIRLVLVASTFFVVALSLGVMLVLRQTGRGAWGPGVFGTLTGILLLWMIRRRPTRCVAWLALLLLVADLLSFDLTLVRFVPQAEVASQGRAAAEWLAAQPVPFRVYSPSYSLPQPAAFEAGLEQIDGVEPVHLSAYDRFMSRAGGYGDSSFGVTIPPFPEGTAIDQAYRDTVPDLGLLGLLNGRYLAAAFPLDLPGFTLRWQNGTTWIYENEMALPRAFAVYYTRPVADEQAWNLLDGVDPARVALVEGGHDLTSPGEPTPARIVSQSANREVVEIDLAAPALLVLSEIWYPGWQARDNGESVPILRTDGVLRGVYLDAGTHTVEFDYRPWTVWVGLAVSGCTALGLLIWALARWWRRA
jgi:hypothetical protein